MGNHSGPRCIAGEISGAGDSPSAEGCAIVILRVSAVEDLKILRTTEPKQHGILLQELLTTRQHVTNNLAKPNSLNMERIAGGVANIATLRRLRADGGH